MTDGSGSVEIQETRQVVPRSLGSPQDTETLGCAARLGRLRRSSENITYEDPSNRSCGYHRQ